MSVNGEKQYLFHISWLFWEVIWKTPWKGGFSPGDLGIGIKVYITPTKEGFLQRAFPRDLTFSTKKAFLHITIEIMIDLF